MLPWRQIFKSFGNGLLADPNDGERIKLEKEKVTKEKNNHDKQQNINLLKS